MIKISGACRLVVIAETILTVARHFFLLFFSRLSYSMSTATHIVVQQYMDGTHLSLAKRKQKNNKKTTKKQQQAKQCQVTVAILYSGYSCDVAMSVEPNSLQWRHNECDGVSNHQPHDCLCNSLFRRRSQKTSKLRVTGLCKRNSPVFGEFPTQGASNAKNVSIFYDIGTGLKWFAMIWLKDRTSGYWFQELATRVENLLKGSCEIFKSLLKGAITCTSAPYRNGVNTERLPSRHMAQK